MPDERDNSDENLEARIRPATEDELPLTLEVEQDADTQGDDEPISLVEEPEEGEERAHPAVREFGRGAAGVKEVEYHRQLNVTGQGATRCRVFHSRIALEALDSMQNRINAWLDSQEIEIKHVGHVIGVMEGKNPKPNVVVLVWY